TATAFGGIGNDTALINDPDESATFDGSSAYLSFPATALPTGNGAWTLEAWLYLSATPAASAYIVQYGANATAEVPNIYVSTANKLIVSQGGNSAHEAASPTALALNTVHHVAGTWDGTTLRNYVDGAQVA